MLASKNGGHWTTLRLGSEEYGTSIRFSSLSLMRSSSRKLHITSFHNWANFEASVLLLGVTYLYSRITLSRSYRMFLNITCAKTKNTCTKCLERENPFFLILSVGTKFALNAPGIDWKRDLSMSRVRICEEKHTRLPWDSQCRESGGTNIRTGSFIIMLLWLLKVMISWFTHHWNSKVNRT